MKALRFVGLILALSFIVAACGPAATPTTVATVAPVPTAAPLPTDTQAVSKIPDLGGREIIVAVENAYPPFNSLDENGKGIGWDYDAFNEICKLLNCVPNFTEAAWDGIFEATAAGQYDVVADGVTITDERKKTVAFSDPYMIVNQVLLVRADETRFTDSKGLAALTDLTVGTQLGTTNEKVAIGIVGESRVKAFETFDAPVLALMSGDVDAVVIDDQAGKGFMRENRGKMVMLPERFPGEELGFVFKQGSDLIDPINKALAEMKANGTLDTLFAKWWPELPDLGGREIIVAVENAYPPFNSLDANGKGIGWDYDAFTEICKLLNCVPNFTEAAWDGIFEATAAGQYDVVADGVTITDERKKTVAFSDPYMIVNQVLLVRADETRFTDSKGLAALTDLTVGTQLGTTNEKVAIGIVGESRVKAFETFDAPVLALISGDVDAVVIDDQAGKGFMKENEGKMIMLPERFPGEELGFVFKQGSDLIDPINKALAEMKANGTLDTLFAKWWPE